MRETVRIIWAWARAAARGGPFLLHWHEGGGCRRRLYGGLVDALLMAQTVLITGAETMDLTDRDERRLPFLAYGVLTWRWGGEEFSVVLRSRAEAQERVAALRAHRALEFVSLLRTDGLDGPCQP